MARNLDVSAILDEQKLGSFNITLLLTSFLLMMCEGFDLSAAAFGGPGIIKEWHLQRADLGVLLSSSLAAGFLGPPLFGYLSDRSGRKLVIVGGVYLFGLLTLAAVASTEFHQLVALRALAGIALAGTLPIIVTLNNEYAPRKYRATFVVIVFAGVTFGGGLPGFVSARYVEEYGWRILFWIGGIAPLLLGTIFALAASESAKFLALRPARKLELALLLNRLRPDLAASSADTYFIKGEENKSKFQPKSLFEGKLILLSPLFWISNLVGQGLFYFMNQLMPTILSDSGMTISQAALATTAFNMGGTAAGLITMRLLDKFGYISVPVCFAFAIPVMACLGIPDLPPGILISLAACAGFCFMGVQFGNISTEGNIYPTYIRAWGVGLNFAAGRIGGALGPLLGGIAFGAHTPMSQIFLIAAIPPCIGLIASSIIVPLYGRRLEVMRDRVDVSAVAVALSPTPLPSNG